MNLKQIWQKHPICTAWSLSLAFLIFRAIYVNFIQLAPDEAYYWEWSRHLALSYYDQGPMLALAIRLGTWLFGNTEFGVRFPALICGLGLSGLAIWFCAGWFKRPKLAPLAVLGLNTMLLYAAGGVLMVHDALQVFFWALALACVGQGIRSGKIWWWLAGGLAGGLGLASKYTGILFVPFLFLALATHPKLRFWLKRPQPYLATMLGALAGIPIVIWNVQYGWPSFQHVFSLAGKDPTRASLTSMPEFILSQIGLVTPVYLYFMVLAWWKGAGDWRRNKASVEFWLVWCLSAPFLLFFLLLSLKTRVEGNWPATAYFGGVLLAIVFVESGKRLSAPAVRWGFVLALALSALVYAQAAWPFLPIPASQMRVDGTARLDGWREMAARVDVELSRLSPGAFAGVRTYQNAAELGFYLKGNPQPLVIQNDLPGHQYRFWNHPGILKGQDAILVVGQDWELDEMKTRFRQVKPLDDFIFFRQGMEARRLHLYAAYGFSG